MAVDLVGLAEVVQAPGNDHRSTLGHPAAELIGPGVLVQASDDALDVPDVGLRELGSAELEIRDELVATPVEFDGLLDRLAHARL